jgi:hypothetical protein
MTFSATTGPIFVMWKIKHQKAEVKIAAAPFGRGCSKATSGMYRIGHVICRSASLDDNSQVSRIDIL